MHCGCVLSQTVQQKSIVALLPRSGDMAGRQAKGKTCDGFVCSKRSDRLAACQYVAFSSIAKGTLSCVATRMKSAAILNGGLVIIAVHSVDAQFRKSTPCVPNPLSCRSVDFTCSPLLSKTFDIAPSPHAGYQNNLSGANIFGSAFINASVHSFGVA